jgi:hypothetical protein
MTSDSWPLLVDRVEAARVLRTTPEKVDGLVSSGRLTAVRLFPDEDPRFRPEDLVELVERAHERFALPRVAAATGIRKDCLRWPPSIRCAHYSTRHDGMG